jgi:hypothetical protein
MGRLILAVLAGAFGLVVGVLTGNLANLLFFGGWYPLTSGDTLLLDSLFHNLGNVSVMIGAGVIGAGAAFMTVWEWESRDARRAA